MRKLTRKEKSYPQLLKEIYRPPSPLYLEGELPAGDYIAVVGARKVSSYGKQAAELIVSGLAQAGLVIVSGLANGVNTIAHQTALAQKGKTLAVLAGGFDHIYPSQNIKLAEKIPLLSEHPPEVKPLRQYFPSRNRIISGLCLGVVIIEAGERSGTSITANFALEQGREVFALPGSIFWENSRGCHRLIQRGAKLITSVSDILEELNLRNVQKLFAEEKIIAENQEERIILKTLSREPLHIDELSRKSQISSRELNSLLTLMELSGKVKNLGNQNYVIGK